MNTLVIGGNSGIGSQVVDDLDGNVWAPGEVELDVTEPYQISSWLMRQGVQYDRVVYSAGAHGLEMIGKMDPNPMRHIFAVNVMGFIHTLDKLRRFQGDYPTSIVAIVSDAATVPMRGSVNYCASKAALAQAIRVAARECAPDWRVNGVSPGIVDDTPMTEYIDATIPDFRGWTAEHARAYEQSQIPMSRRCTKREVAQVVISTLNGPGFLTGAIIPLTGGK
jgi:NAD(P)-dependent dehydrogenase (short-subunit alcohol dehydrogenase family)